MKHNNIYCHETNYGKNYGIEVNEKTNTARLFSYFTNGATNSNYEYTRWRKLDHVKKVLGEKTYNKIVNTNKGGEYIEGVIGRNEM